MFWFNFLGFLVSKLVNAAETKAEEGEEYHPLLPVEKKLVTYSLILAVILLVILIYVSYTYFGVAH
ncbi:MAG: hypothetical protein ACUX7D_08850 [Candidatus Methanodesulfokora washburnensis]|jgi:hypothetical protein